MRDLWSELKRRNVFRVGIFYLVAAWLVVEVAETVLPLFDVPAGVLRGLIVLLALGFVPALVFSWIYELTPEGLKRDEGPTQSAAPSTGTGRRLNWATMVVALLAIGMVAYDRLAPRAPGVGLLSSGTAPVTADTGHSIADASIAVLPFADLSPGRDQEYFSDGMAEEILNALARIDALRVASRTSCFSFKGQEQLGIPVIAERLGVRHVVEGSVRRAGNTLRITAQLIDARSDRHLWSDTFDRPLTAENIIAIQEEIASAIVAALVDSLGIDVDRAVKLEAPTGNLTAYDLYLQARALFQARRDFDTADELLERALSQDGGFAKAWELRAAVQPLMRGYGYTNLSRDELEQRAIEFAGKAVALDPASSMALATLAFIRSRATANLRERHDLAVIIGELERAVVVDPRNTSALNWLGLALGHVGRLETALEVFQRCMDVDPTFGPCTENEYDTLWVLGRADEAFAHMLAAFAGGAMVDEYVNFALLARFEQKAVFMFAANQSGWLQGWRRHEELYEAYRNLQDDHSALAAELVRFSDLGPGDRKGVLPNLLIPLGAYDLLPFPLLMWGPDYAGYRRSPQFRDFVSRSGALDYWRAHGYPPQCRARGIDDFQCDGEAGQ